VCSLALAKGRAERSPALDGTLSQIQGAERVAPAKEWRHALQHPAALGGTQVWHR